MQKLPDNQYYQNFSYSISSKVPFQTWDDPVSILNHTSGFEKFADLKVNIRFLPKVAIMTARG